MDDSEYYTYGNIKLERGNFDSPPVLIGTIFYQNETLVDRKNPEIFNTQKAMKRIETHQSLSKKYKIPNLLEISATTPKSMIRYLEFYLDHFNPPFILGGNFESRVAGIEYLTENGIKSDQYIYNTISNLKNKKEIEIIHKHKLKSVVILILGSENMSSTQRYAYITEKSQPNNMSIIDGLKKIGIEKLWIDGGVVNLESLAHILETHQLVSTSLKLPVGTAPNLFLFQYSSPRLNIKYHTRYRRASIMFIATWFSNFIFYGAIEDAKESFSSAYQSVEFREIIRSKNIKLFKQF
ncbi:Methylcorrinoid:tetrahydrofolate methyltransferase [subsurface metagenome]